MFRKIKYKLNKKFKILLHIILCVQLCMSPIYAYPNANPGEENGHQDIDFTALLEELEQLDHQLERDHLANPLRIDNQLMPEFLNFAKAIEDGKEMEFLTEHPDIREYLDLFLLAHQRVETISAGNTTSTIELNDKISRHLHIVCDEVLVKYDKGSKELIFEGRVNNETVLKQYIPNMDIIDFSHDKEILVLLDRKKGLLLIDMLLARSYIGATPFPVARVPAPILQYLDRQSLSQEEIKSIDLEFVNRFTRLPDIQAHGMNIDFRGEYVASAGNIMLSYMDAKGNKHLLQLLTREMMAYNINITYKILNLMAVSQDPTSLISNQEKMREFIRNRNEVMEDARNIPVLNVSALFTKDALSKLNQVADGIEARVAQLNNISPEDKMSLQEWKENFDKSHSQILDWKRYFASNPVDEHKRGKDEREDHQIKLMRGLMQKLNRSEEEGKEAGDVFSTEEIFQLKTPPPDFEKVGMFRKLASVAKKVVALDMDSISELKEGNDGKTVERVVWLSLVAAFFYMVITKNYIDGTASYQMTTLHNVLLVGIVLPLSVIIAVQLKTPFLALLEAVIPDEKRDSFRRYRKKWKAMKLDKKIVSLGFKFIGYMMYPLTHYSIKVISPHFLSALQKGLNPWRTIVPVSDVGKVLGIEKPVRLGFGLNYSPGIQFKEDESFEKSRQLQNLVEGKERRMQTVALLLALVATTQKGVDPVQAVVYGLGRLNLENVDIHDDLALRMKIIWVWKNLLKEIKNVDKMDIQKMFSELDPKDIVEYYKRAEELVEELDNRPVLREKVNNAMRQVAWVREQTVLRHFTWHNIVSFNEEEFIILKKNEPSASQTDRVIREFVGDHIPMSGVPLVATDRADFSLENTEKLAVHPNGFYLSGEPHIQETGFNTVGHFFIAAGQAGLVLADKRKLIEQAYGDVSETYAPEEIYSDKIRDNKQDMSNYLNHVFLDYIFKSKGKPGNFGEVAWKKYLARFKTMQMTLTLLVLLRWGLTESTLSESFMGALFFHFAGYWLFGWPWDVVFGGYLMNNNILAKNKAKLEGLKLTLSRVSKGMVANEADLFNEYEFALRKVVELYGFALPQQEGEIEQPEDETESRVSRKTRLLKEKRKARAKKTQELRQKLIVQVETVNPELSVYLKNFNPAEELPVSRDIEMTQETAKKLVKLIAQSPPLPTEAIGAADRLVSLGFGGFLTTYLAVQLLSILAFDKDFLNWHNIALVAGGNYLGYTLIYQFWNEGWFYKKLANTGFGRGTGKVFTTSWKHSKNWSLYFYENVLDLGHSAKSACRRVFN